ncbi:MAG: hypothetical protein Kow00114_02060 [Kiloniellaceae bacterium]
MIGRAHAVDLLLGLAVLALCIWMGLTAQGFSPFAALFPTFIALVCGAITVALLAFAALGRLAPPPPVTGSGARRLMLCAALAAWIALIPWLGFVLASVPGFIAVGLAAKYTPWTRRQWLLFCLLAVGCVVALSLFFVHALNVPLARGSLFGG